MYHHYIDNQYNRPGIPPGAGNHPSDAWLAQQGYHRVAQQPPAPASGMVWQASTPPYALVDGVSTPQGAWDGAATALSKASLEDDGVYLVVSAGRLA